MLFSAVIYNWVGILGTLIGAVLWVIIIAVALKLLKVARPVPAGTTLVAARFLLTLLRGGVALTVIGFLGILLAGSLVYLITRSPPARKVGGIVSVVLVGLVLFLTLVRSDPDFNITDSNHQIGTSSSERELMHEQMARIRKLRQQEDQQRRALFESQKLDADAPPDDNAGQVNALNSSPGVAWYPEVDERFESDVHPSAVSAGRAIARKLLPLIKHVTSQEVDPSIVQIYGSGIHRDTLKALDGLAATMRQRYPDAQILLEKGTHWRRVTGLDANAISIKLMNSNLEMKRRSQKNYSQIEKVDLTAEMSGRGNGGSGKQVNVSVTMVDKLWVHEFDEFLAADLGRFPLINAQSGRLATSELDARNAAIKDAVDMLTPFALEFLKTQPQPVLRTPSKTELTDRLITELAGGELVLDRFSQQLAHPMGDLWREAILVEVDYTAMHRVVSAFVLQQRETERGQLSLGVALVLLTLGIIVLHMLLNLITKGYYRKSVGIARRRWCSGHSDTGDDNLRPRASVGYVKRSAGVPSKSRFDRLARRRFA